MGGHKEAHLALEQEFGPRGDVAERLNLEFGISSDKPLPTSVRVSTRDRTRDRIRTVEHLRARSMGLIG